MLGWTWAHIVNQGAVWHPDIWNTKINIIIIKQEAWITDTCGTYFKITYVQLLAENTQDTKLQ